LAGPRRAFASQEQAMNALAKELLDQDPNPAEIREWADQIHAFARRGRSFTVLGTDGYGRSDTRAHLLDFFESNDRWITHAAIAALAEDGVLTDEDVAHAFELWQLDPAKPNPIQC
jgi:pyruvate dehydrogenase E1 component